VKHTHLDLTGKPAEMANELEGIHAEYLFFSAYLQKDTEQENWDVNGTLVLSSAHLALAPTFAIR
jgi:hypothetical protein